MARGLWRVVGSHSRLSDLATAVALTFVAGPVAAGCSCDKSAEGNTRDVKSVAGSGGQANDVNIPEAEADHASMGGSAGTDVRDAGGAGNAGGWWDDAATEWKPVAWTPPECEQRYATEPDRALPALQWQKCPGDVPGCSLFEVPAPPEQEVVSDIDVTRTSAGYRVSLAVQVVYVEPRVRTVGLYDESGKAIFAMRGRVEGCIPYAPRLHDTRVCGAVGLITEATEGLHVACASAADIPGLPAATKIFPFGVQGLWLGDGILTLWVGPGANGVYVLPPEDRLIQFTYDVGATFFEHPNTAARNTFVVGSRPGGIQDGFVFSVPNQLEAVVQPAPQVVVDINGDATSLVWIQADPRANSPDYVFQNASLWRSPLATTAAQLSASKIRDLGTVPGEPFSLAGSGYYAVLLSGEQFEVFRVSDGRHWTASVPAGYEPKIYFPWLDENHLFYQVARAVPGRKIGVVQQRLDALGPGD